MQINEIEPKFHELDVGVDGAMAQIGDLEKRMEQLAAKTGMRLDLLETHAHQHTGAGSEMLPIDPIQELEEYEESGDPVQDVLEEITEDAKPHFEPESESEPVESEQGDGGKIGLQPDTAGGAEADATFQEDKDNVPFSELVATDVRPFSAAAVANAIMNHPKLRHARELVMKPETGVMEKVQAFRFTDGTFMVPSRETFERLVRETKIDEIEWVKNVSDCEDICLRFNAKCIELGINSCGRIMSWSGGHCFIISIVRDSDSLGFAFLEPQTDQLLTDEVGDGKYSLEDCLIIVN